MMFRESKEMATIAKSFVTLVVSKIFDGTDNSKESLKQFVVRIYKNAVFSVIFLQIVTRFKLDDGDILL